MPTLAKPVPNRAGFLVLMRLRLLRTNAQSGTVTSPNQTQSETHSMNQFKPIALRTLCASGVSLSIQASRFHYSTPRDDEGPYSHVEVGFIKNEDGPVTPPETWEGYGDCGFPADVYAYVPVTLVEAFIASNGGRIK